jgi:hypothetical protein
MDTAFRDTMAAGRALEEPASVLGSPIRDPRHLRHPPRREGPLTGAP